MAYTKLTNMLPTATSWHTHLIPAMDTFLQANGWVREHYDVSSDTTWKLVMSKGGVFFQISYNAVSSFIFITGHGWDGATLLGSSYIASYALANISGSQLYANPSAIYLISQGSCFYTVCLQDDYTITGVDSLWFGAGMLDKFGTYSGGRFTFRPETASAPDSVESGSYQSVQIGDVGSFGTAPYMWNYGYDAVWDIDMSSYNKFTNSVGRTNVSSMATPLLPMYIRCMDGDAGIWRPVGTVPKVLKCWSLQVHHPGDIIDHLGKQWLCFSLGTDTGRMDCVHTLFQLDD